MSRKGRGKRKMREEEYGGRKKKRKHYRCECRHKRSDPLRKTQANTKAVDGVCHLRHELARIQEHSRMANGDKKGSNTTGRMISAE